MTRGCSVNGQTDKQTDKQTDLQIDRQIDRQTNHTGKHETAYDSSTCLNLIKKHQKICPQLYVEAVTKSLLTYHFFNTNHYISF